MKKITQKEIDRCLMDMESGEPAWVLAIRYPGEVVVAAMELRGGCRISAGRVYEVVEVGA